MQYKSLEKNLQTVGSLAKLLFDFEELKERCARQAVVNYTQNDVIYAVGTREFNIYRYESNVGNHYLVKWDDLTNRVEEIWLKAPNSNLLYSCLGLGYWRK